MGDIHCTKTSHGVLQPLFAEAAHEADVIVLCGDLTDYGLPDEAHVLVKELAAAERTPIVAVLGNHDFESAMPREVSDILCDAGVHLLDGDSVEIKGVGFAGVKGFAGGFGKRALGPWGEDSIKAFVREAVDEALKLETAIARLNAAARVAVLHYSPIEATVLGEPPEIFPFLGSSRLEEPLLRYPVSLVVHGHAHHGSPEGRTTVHDIPVYNVSMPLLKEHFPQGPGFRLLEVALDPEAPVTPSVPAATEAPTAKQVPVEQSALTALGRDG